ncbi:MAG TPA: histidine kinase, partial [Bacilli bacterium]
YSNILQDPVIEHWSIEVPGSDQVIFHGDKMNKLLLTKVLKNYRTLRPEGVLILGIDERDIRSSYSPGPGPGKIIVLNKDGVVLSDNRGEWIGRSLGDLPFFDHPVNRLNDIDDAVNRKDWVFAHLQSAVTGWHVLVLQPRDALLRKLSRIKWITLVIVFVTLLISIAVSFSISGVITKPIQKIVLSMKKFQRGDFSQNVQFKGNDEIGQLGSGYNIMVQRIKDLINDVYASEIKQRQAELKLLQSQINPHFFYNTLNSIAWSAHKNNDHQVADMIYSLSGIFKISLNAGKEVIPLQQEFELVRHYLSLQKFRYSGKLNYEIEMLPELKNVNIPKLLIQPLVENAVVHGIEPLADDNGLICVSAALSADGRFIEINITDNGVGIPEDKLREMNLQLRANSDPGSSSGENFALLNIRNRIRLFYGEDASLHIQSVFGSGTRVMLTLPYKGKI